MKRSFLYGLLGLISVGGMAVIPTACVAGGVGDACVPEDEYSFRFSGFKVSEDIIESRSFQCATRICLVNHFQGRVSCPLGQPAPVNSQGGEGCAPDRDGNGNYVKGQGNCKDGDTCVEAGSFSPSCDPSQGDVANQFCIGLGAGQKCNEAGFCECATNADCLFTGSDVVSCDAKTKQCVSYACHKEGDCQQEGAAPKDNAGKACCLPGTDTPVTTPVCGQCKGPVDKPPTRNAENAVYCSCRCGVAEGEPDDPNFNFCTCPDGYACEEIRKNVGLGDEKITGKYCIKTIPADDGTLVSTKFDPNQDQCGQVDGYWVSGGNSGIRCDGTGTGLCATKEGKCENE
ncbi:MAG: hypothetical protein IPK82_02365 [Polyangiaceae bacterium]|nr:hypothetical protein [Polyangiaceae bacterium]